VQSDLDDGKADFKFTHIGFIFICYGSSMVLVTSVGEINHKLQITASSDANF